MRKFNLGHPDVLAWPMTSAQLANLGPTKMVSPMVGVAHGTTAPTDAELKLDYAEVKRVVDDVKANRFPGWLFLEHTGSYAPSPILSQYLLITEVNFRAGINYVATDHPFDFWDRVVEPWAKANAIPYRIPPGPGVPFLHSVNVRALAHESIAAALAKCFQAKYFHGVPRPCEILDNSVNIIPCPSHPSYMAGHAVFFSASALAFETHYNPTPDQATAMRLAAKQLGLYRVLCGIHSARDCNDGDAFAFSNA